MLLQRLTLCQARPTIAAQPRSAPPSRHISPHNGFRPHHHPWCSTGSHGASWPLAPPMAQRMQAPRRSLHVRRTASNATGAPAAPAPGLYEGKTAVVVGGGPAGATAAMYLARQGFKVDVHERRPEPSQDEVDTGRAYIIIIIPRGQAALNELGIELPTDGPYRTLGTVRHRPKGKLGITKEDTNITFSRSGLAQYLIDQARERHPGRIAFHFNSRCKGIDFEQQLATFEVTDAKAGTLDTSPDINVSRSSSGAAASTSQASATAAAAGATATATAGAATTASTATAAGGRVVQQSYDLCIGADGVGSAVRAELQQHHQDMTVQVDDSGREYKTYKQVAPPPGGIEPPEFAGRVGSTLHLWTSDDPWTTVTAHRNPDGTYSGTFSLVTGGFKELGAQGDYEALLRKKFAGLPVEWLPLIAAQVVKEAPSSAGKRIKCSRLDGPHLLLLGDAAHAVTPVFGQGANSSLESCKVLDSVLTAAGGDVAAVPGMFTEARLADMHALNELDRKAYSFFRKRGPLDPDFLQLLSHVVLGTVLSKIVPFLYGSKPALLKLGTTTPYADIVKAVRRDSLAAAVVAVVGLLVLAAKVALKAVAV